MISLWNDTHFFFNMYFCVLIHPNADMMIRRSPCSGTLRTVVCVLWPPIFRVLHEPNVSRLAGDDTGLILELSPEVWPGGSSPKRRRLALPAAGELYLSWTDSGEGGTSGGGNTNEQM